MFSSIFTLYNNYLLNYDKKLLTFKKLAVIIIQKETERKVCIMNQVFLSKWMKAVVIAVGLCGLVIYGWVVPCFGQMIVQNNPEFTYCYTPWLVFLCVTGVPCYAVLVLIWKIATNIGADRSFTAANAKFLKHISMLAGIDAGFFFVTNIVYLFLNLNHPGIVIMSLVVVFVGIAISVAAAVLSHLVMKAAALQEQSDFTI